MDKRMFFSDINYLPDVLSDAQFKYLNENGFFSKDLRNIVLRKEHDRLLEKGYWSVNAVQQIHETIVPYMSIDSIKVSIYKVTKENLNEVVLASVNVC